MNPSHPPSHTFPQLVGATRRCRARPAYTAHAGRAGRRTTRRHSIGSCRDKEQLGPRALAASPPPERMPLMEHRLIGVLDYCTFKSFLQILQPGRICLSTFTGKQSRLFAFPENAIIGFQLYLRYVEAES